MKDEELMKIEEDVINVVELEPTESNNPYLAAGIVIGTVVIAGVSYLVYKRIKNKNAAEGKVVRKFKMFNLKNNTSIEDDVEEE